MPDDPPPETAAATPRRPAGRAARATLAFPDSPPVRLDAQGRIEADLPCPRCAYLLRGRRPGDACPECGREIDAEGLGAGLGEEAEGFRRPVLRGARRLALGMALLPLGIYPGLAVATAGVWGLTVRPPGPAEPWLKRNGRLFARWFTALGLPAMAAAVAWSAWTAWSRRGVGGSWTLQDAVLCGTHALFFIGLMFGWRHLFDLAARADAPGAALTLKKLWRGYFWALLAVAAVAMTVNVVEEFDLLYRVGPGLRRLAAPLAAATLLLVGAGLWAWTLVRVRAFRRALETSLGTSRARASRAGPAQPA